LLPHRPSGSLLVNPVKNDQDNALRGSQRFAAFRNLGCRRGSSQACGFTRQRSNLTSHATVTLRARVPMRTLLVACAQSGMCPTISNVVPERS
jgi:hypothetical protein